MVKWHRVVGMTLLQNQAGIQLIDINQHKNNYDSTTELKIDAKVAEIHHEVIEKIF